MTLKKLFAPPFLPSFQAVFAGSRVAAFIGRLDRFFIKLPHLPRRARLLISKIVPFLALAFGIIGLLASLITGFFLVLALLAWDTVILGELSLSFGLVLLDTLLLLKAFKPLRAGNAVGWIYLFWAQSLEVLSFISRMVNGESNWWLGSLTLVLGYYLLFEIGQFYVYKRTET